MSKHVPILYGALAGMLALCMCLVYACAYLEQRVEHAEWVGTVATDNAELAELRAKQAQRSCDRTFDTLLQIDPLINGDKVFVTECEADPFGVKVCRLTAAPLP